MASAAATVVVIVVMCFDGEKRGNSDGDTGQQYNRLGHWAKGQWEPETLAYTTWTERTREGPGPTEEDKTLPTGP